MWTANVLGVWSWYCSLKLLQIDRVLCTSALEVICTFEGASGLVFPFFFFLGGLNIVSCFVRSYATGVLPIYSKRCEACPRSLMPYLDYSFCFEHLDRDNRTLYATPRSIIPQQCTNLPSTVRTPIPNHQYDPRMTRAHLLSRPGMVIQVPQKESKGRS